MTPPAVPTYGAPPVRDVEGEQERMRQVLTAALVAQLLGGGGGFGSQAMSAVLQGGGAGVSDLAEREYADDWRDYQMRTQMGEMGYTNELQRAAAHNSIINATNQTVTAERVDDDRREDNARLRAKEETKAALDKRKLATQILGQIYKMDPASQEAAWRQQNPALLRELGIGPSYDASGRYVPVNFASVTAALKNAATAEEALALQEALGWAGIDIRERGLNETVRWHDILNNNSDASRRLTEIHQGFLRTLGQGRLDATWANVGLRSEGLNLQHQKFADSISRYQQKREEAVKSGDPAKLLRTNNERITEIQDEIHKARVAQSQAQQLFDNGEIGQAKYEEEKLAAQSIVDAAVKEKEHLEGENLTLQGMGRGDMSDGRTPAPAAAAVTRSTALPPSVPAPAPVVLSRPTPAGMAQYMKTPQGKAMVGQLFGPPAGVPPPPGMRDRGANPGAVSATERTPAKPPAGKKPAGKPKSVKQLSNKEVAEEIAREIMKAAR